MDSILMAIQKSGWSLGEYLEVLFTIEPRGGVARSRIHSKMVSKFLQAGNTEKAEDVVELMYSSKDSAQKSTRNMNARTNGGASVGDSGVDPISMPLPEKSSKIDFAKAAHAKLTEWTINKVEKIVSEEAEELSGKKGGFHLKTADEHSLPSEGVPE
jgi:pentatricopeptide repeat protein